MKLETSVMIMPMQPDEHSWNYLQQFAFNWNLSHRHTFSECAGLMLELRFSDSAHPEHCELLVLLEQIKSEFPFQIHLSHRRIYDVSDYEFADFIEINGVVLDDDQGHPLVVNALQVLTPSACPQCGYIDAFDQIQSGPLIINESMLPTNLDFVDISAGLKVVSSNFAAILVTHGVEGFTLEPVLDSAGLTSKRYWQLRAQRSILVPCPEHTPAIDGAFCPTCGAAHCTVESEDWVREDEIRNHEIFSRHRMLGAIFYVSGRVYHHLVAAGLQQIKPSRIFRKCRHSYG
jgi:hypothetical protein